MADRTPEERLLAKEKHADAVRDAARTVFLSNAGAAAAVLAYLGTRSAGFPPCSLALVACGAIVFIFGVAAAAFGDALRWRSHQAWDFPGSLKLDLGLPFARRVIYAGIVAFVLGAVLCGIGIFMEVAQRTAVTSPLSSPAVVAKSDPK